MGELESVEIRLARLDWALNQSKIDRENLAKEVMSLSLKIDRQAEDIDKLRTWRAQMVAVLMAATTAISLLIKKFWN
jgi:hypothetical protein